jgi:hypothetical protein
MCPLAASRPFGRLLVRGNSGTAERTVVSICQHVPTFIHKDLPGRLRAFSVPVATKTNHLSVRTFSCINTVNETKIQFYLQHIYPNAMPDSSSILKVSVHFRTRIFTAQQCSLTTKLRTTSGEVSAVKHESPSDRLPLSEDT